ncbi:MAG: c-type cytochrome, partial [Myxococcales bacterium]|nr:c-type cytochrome [Myxococcales bacterium]
AGGGGAAPGGAPSTSEGEALYTQYCLVCHGPEGAGAPPYPGSIQGHADLWPVIRDGMGEMPAFPQLTVGDAAAIEAWLAILVADAAPPTPRDVYATECAACHGANGEGAQRGPQIRNPVVPYATWVVRNGRPGSGYADAMPPYGEDELTPGELDEILGWLSAMPKPADGAGLFRTFCANCHGANGRGGPVGEGIVGEGVGEWIEVVREGEGGRNYGRRGGYMPSWSRAQLTDAEIRLMYEAVSGSSGGAGRGGGGYEREEDDD